MKKKIIIMQAWQYFLQTWMHDWTIFQNSYQVNWKSKVNMQAYRTFNRTFDFCIIRTYRSKYIYSVRAWLHLKRNSPLKHLRRKMVTEESLPHVKAQACREFGNYSNILFFQHQHPLLVDRIQTFWGDHQVGTFETGFAA